MNKRSRLKLVILGTAVLSYLIVSLISTGCAYALQPVILPSQYRLKVAANTPTRYSVRLRVPTPHEYPVPADGRVTLDIPAYRPGCKVYIFGGIKIGGASDPFTARAVDLRI